MNEEKLRGVEALIEAARAVREPQMIDVNITDGGTDFVAPMLARPIAGGGIEMVSVRAEIDKYRPHPERRAGTAKLGDLDSFKTHVNRFKDADSAVFISDDPKRPSFLAVLDYHEAVNPLVLDTPALPMKAGDPAAEMVLRSAGPALPRFGVHRSSYVPAFSEEWILWTNANGQSLTQQAFAALIETGARDILDVENEHPERLSEMADWFAKRFGAKVDPALFFGSSALMLEMAEGLTATIEDTIGDVTSRAGGVRSLTFTSKTSTTIDVPPAFLLSLPIFRGGDLWQIPARLKMTPRQKGEARVFEWRVDLYGVDRTVKACVEEMSKSVRAATSLPVFVGAPEA